MHAGERAARRPAGRAPQGGGCAPGARRRIAGSCSRGHVLMIQDRDGLGEAAGWSELSGGVDLPLGFLEAARCRSITDWRRKRAP